MTDLITFLDNNIKSLICTGVNILGLYRYLEMIGYPTTLTTSDQISHHFGLLSSTKNDTDTLQPVIATLCIQQKIIF